MLTCLFTRLARPTSEARVNEKNAVLGVKGAPVVSVEPPLGRKPFVRERVEKAPCGKLLTDMSADCVAALVSVDSVLMLGGVSIPPEVAVDSVLLP